MAITPNASALSQLYNYLGQTANPEMQSRGGADLQSLIDSGYLYVSPQGEGYGAYELGGNAPKSLSTMFRPSGISGQDRAIDPSQVNTNSPYGPITSTQNIYHPSEHDAFQKYIQPIMEMALGAGFGGLVSQFGGGLGGIGNTLFKGAGSEILGGGGNPLASLQNLFSRGGGNTASQVSPLLSILALLGRLGKGGTTPS